MFEPIDFTRIEAALVSPAGWWELAIVAACFAVGWMLDRRVRLESASEAEVVRLSLGSVNRLLLPLVTLVLMLVASAVFARWHPPFFLPIAIPLMVALALIRLHRLRDAGAVRHARRGCRGPSAWSRSRSGGSSCSTSPASCPSCGPSSTRWTSRIGSQACLRARAPEGQRRADPDDRRAACGCPASSSSGCSARRNLDSSVRAVLSKFVRALLLAVGVLVALQAVGIDLTVLTVFGGALGVGIGLGLQKLASNYIAGFTILLDRSIRLGDVITVDNRFGVVAKVTSRYVIVRSFDGVEAVVPNETLVTTTVLNHSYSDREIRVAVTVQVGYDTDVEQALKLMEAAAHGRAARAEGAERADGVPGPIRRGRHRARAGGLDQRSRNGPAQPAELDPAGDLEFVPRERHQALLRAARLARAGPACRRPAAPHWPPTGRVPRPDGGPRVPAPRFGGRQPSTSAGAVFYKLLF